MSTRNKTVQKFLQTYRCVSSKEMTGHTISEEDVVNPFKRTSGEYSNLQGIRVPGTRHFF